MPTVGSENDQVAPESKLRATPQFVPMYTSLLVGWIPIPIAAGSVRRAVAHVLNGTGPDAGGVAVAG